ncbi:Sterol 3-beta-glucosyltransferase [Sorochytrium milnesiophthora]
MVSTAPLDCPAAVVVHPPSPALATSPSPPLPPRSPGSGYACCYYIHNVLLVGSLHIADASIATSVCFNAKVPNVDETHVVHSGFMWRRSMFGMHSARQWYTLHGFTLSCYEDSQSIYSPIETVDLRTIQSIALSTKRPLSFKLRTAAGKSLHFSADSPQSLREWTKAIQECLFRAYNGSNDVHVVLPLRKIASVQRVASPVLPSAAVAGAAPDGGATDSLLITLAPTHSPEHDGEKTYHFAFFRDVEQVYNRLTALVGDPAAQCAQPSPAPPRPPALEHRLSASSTASAPLPKKGHHRRISDLTSIITAKLKITASSGSDSDGDSALSPNMSAASDGAPSPALGTARPQLASPVSNLMPLLISASPVRLEVADPSGSLSPLYNRQDSAVSVTNKLRAPLPEGRGAVGFNVSARHDSLAQRRQLHRQSRQSRLQGFGKSLDLGRRRPLLLDNDDDTDVDKSNIKPKATERRPVRYAEDDLSLELHASLPRSAPALAPIAISGDNGDRAVQGLGILSAESSSLAHPSHVDEDLIRTFGLPSWQRLIADVTAYLVKTIPRYGRLYLFQDYLCFLSRVVGLRTIIVVPLQDVLSARLESPGVIIHAGLTIGTRDGGAEMCFDFRDQDVRSSIYGLLPRRLHMLDDDVPTLECLDSSEHSQRVTDIARRRTRTNTLLRLNSAEDILSSSSCCSLLPANIVPLSKTPGPMRITILTIGTRGDVQPFIALCKRLKRDGHHCRIATHAEYQPWVESHDLEFRPVAGDPAEIMQLCVDNGMFSVSFIREVFAKFRGWMTQLLESAWLACEGSDLIVESAGALNAGYHIAERLQIPLFRSFLMPWTRTTAFPHPFAIPDARTQKLLLGGKAGGYNYMSFSTMEQLMWMGTRSAVNAWRKDTLGLAPIWTFDPSHIPFLYGFSPSMVPAPPDWCDWIHVCGYWFLDNPDVSWTPPESLLKFLEQDSARTVYIGFGSIVVPDPDAMTQAVVEAVKKAGVRAIVSKGWSDRGSKDKHASAKKTTAAEQQQPQQSKEPMPDCIYEVQSVPHDWLFPRVAAAMHHGGSGTTAAALRAGIPAAIKPFFGDQFFWANRLQEMGIGVNVRKLTADRMAAALQQMVDDKKMRQAAKYVGERIRAENGVENAVQFIYRDLEYSREIMQALGAVRR